MINLDVISGYWLLVTGYWHSKSNTTYQSSIKNIWLILGLSLILLVWQSTGDVFAAMPCLTCHPAAVPTTEIQVTECNSSGHAKSLETLKASPDAEDACLKCHTADYVFDQNITLDKTQLNNDCAVCHEDHISKGIFADVEPTLLKPKAEVCNECHSADDAKPGEKPPSAQVEIFAGMGGAGVSDSPGIHYTLMKDNDGCATCHFFKEKEDEVSEVGGHTFKANPAACLKCHTDPAVAEKKQADAQKQISDQLAELKPLLETFADKESEDFKNAEFNINLVEISGDLGAHNLTYSKKLLDYSASVLKGGEKPKAEEPCLLCHKALSAVQVTGWEQSKHASSLETLLASTDVEDECLQCHSVDYQNDPTLTLQTAQLPNGCGGCHADHKGIEQTFSDIGKDLLKPVNELCNDCHTVSGAKPGETLPSAQVEIFTGTGGIGVPDSPSIHSPIMKDGCVYCHTPSMKSETGEDISHTFESNTAVCSTCHKDPAATLTQAKEQISTQLTELIKLLDEYTDKESENFKNAKFNVDLVSVGESGAHNLKYSLNLLEYSASLLTPVEFPAYDVNQDGIVNISDLVIVGAHFGEDVVNSPTHNPDVDGNGTVDISDLVLIELHFGEIIAPAIAATGSTDE